MERKYNNQKGFLTLEIVLCLALVPLFFFGIVELAFSNQNMEIDAQNNAKALALAQTGMEEALAQGFNLTPPADFVDGDFTQHLQVDWLADYAKQISSRAGFTVSGRPGKAELSTLVVDPDGALGRDTCALGFTGNWQVPVLRGAIGNSQGRPATGVDVNNQKVYVTVDGNGALDDFFVVDASDLDHPVVLGSISTGPGLNAVHVAGSYAYVANQSANGQLEIINISNPVSPVLFNQLDLSPPADGYGKSIFFHDNKIYLGLEKNAGPEFFVIDVSNPLRLTVLGSLETDTVVNDIYVYGNYAYLATGDINRFRVLKIDDPAHITEVGDFSDGEPDTVQSGESVAALGGKIVFGRAGGLPNAHIPELYLLNADDPGNINKLNSADINMSINGIFMRKGLVFLATNKTGGEFQVYNLANDQLSSVSSAALPATAVGIDCEGENFFAALDNGTILQIVSPR